ncbi:hypothetical protein H5410_036081 [Solanum commersonii]|uniref:Uncharacterized protein n=1 Tax=Solanum commersonii TaxID=4109 RepID=A0A9J5Y349_SOLCO|nr:hypothetical protein H5410_036081 [Solanum commersonii]
MLPLEQNQESKVWSPISSPPHDHFNNDLKMKNQSSLNLQKINVYLQKIGEKEKGPMPEFYELNPINKPTFSNLIQGGTSEIKLKKEDKYDYYQDVAILKSIYYYFFNHGIAGYDPNIINPIHREIFGLSIVWLPISSPPHDHFDNYLQNEESIISESAKDEVVDEIENQKATEKGKLPSFDLYEMRCVYPKIREKGKSPVLEFYELKPIRGTSEIKLKKEDNYDYYQDIANLKYIYHYFFNHRVIPYPNYSENFINYIEALIPKLKFRGQSLKNKIIIYDPNIMHPIYCEIIDLSMGLWINFVDCYQVGKEIEETDDNLRNWSSNTFTKNHHIKMLPGKEVNGENSEVKQENSEVDEQKNLICFDLIIEILLRVSEFDMDCPMKNSSRYSLAKGSVY